MAYTPDPTDVSQPTSDVKASTAAAEFRAIKDYIKTLVVGAITAGPGTRQTALIGSQDANGDPNFLAAGTGLALNLSALSAPLVLSYAAGSFAAGDLNYNEALGADANNVVTGLAPSNLNYITKIFNGAWDKTLAPWQYGKVFDKTAQLLVRWPGINNATSTTEDFGNTLTFAGNAKLSTATQILGLNTVALDGTGDYVSCPMTSLGDTSWEVFGSFRTASLAATQTVINLGQAAAYRGLMLRLTAAGLFNLFISSNATGDDIVPGTAGTTVVAINTTYFYRITYDSVAGTYRLYLSNNGAAEIQDITVTSALKICNTPLMYIGEQIGAALAFNGNIGFTGIRRFASFTSAQAAGPAVAPTFEAVKSDFFNTSQMKMYQITAESTVAGVNPTMVAVNKLYLGEAITGVAAVTTAVSYGFKNRYDSGWFNILASNTYPKAHNLGVIPSKVDIQMKRFTVIAQGYFDFVAAYAGLAPALITNKSISIRAQAGVPISNGISDGRNGGDATEARVIVERGW
jgi:hypothetical protein